MEVEIVILPGKNGMIWNVTQHKRAFHQQTWDLTNKRLVKSQDTLGISATKNLDLTCKNLFHQPQSSLRWGLASSKVT